MKKILSILLSSLIIFTFVSCKDNKKEEDKEYQITIFSDLHYGDHNYNDFNCTEGLNKLEKIIDETKDCAFYINLGDFIDNMQKNTTFLDEAITLLEKKGISIYNEGKEKKLDRVMYTLIGNHETNTYPKKDISKYIPYVENVGQVFSFEFDGILFIAIDANFNRDNGSDDMADMYCTKFTIPNNEVEWFKNTVDNKLTEDIGEVIILSHIPIKDIEQRVIWELIDYITINYPSHHITMFDGHTHVKSYTDFSDENTNISYLTEYTLPAVTSEDNYEYYCITIKKGEIIDVKTKRD